MGPVRGFHRAVIACVALLTLACQEPPSGLAGSGGDDGGDGNLESMAGFSWVDDGRLAGLPRPGARRDLAEDLQFLRGQDIEVLVSLTVVSTSPESAAAAGIEVVHIPVVDFTAPSQDQIHAFIAKADAAMADGRAVGVHCGAGLGRTGTMLAAWFVSQGLSASEALATIRELRPGSVETEEQEQAIAQYHESLTRSLTDLKPAAGTVSRSDSDTH